MSARTLVVDSGGTARQVKRWIVVDAGGTARVLKRAFVIDSGGTARLIFSAGVITLQDQTVSVERTDPADATATYSLLSNGTGWVDPAPPSKSYDVLATFVSGDLPSGTFGSWLSLSVSRSWSLSQTTIGSKTGIFTVQIRDATTLEVLDSATITLNAVVSA